MKKTVWISFWCGNNPNSKTCTELSRSIENPKWLGIVAIGVIFALFGAVAQAQQPKKVPKIGFLSSSSSPSEPFRHGLRDLGWVEGQNITIEYRLVAGKVASLPAMAEELAVIIHGF